MNEDLFFQIGPFLTEIEVRAFSVALGARSEYTALYKGHNYHHRISPIIQEQKMDRCLCCPQEMLRDEKRMLCFSCRKSCGVKQISAEITALLDVAQAIPEMHRVQQLRLDCIRVYFRKLRRIQAGFAFVRQDVELLQCQVMYALENSALNFLSSFGCEPMLAKAPSEREPLYDSHFALVCLAHAVRQVLQTVRSRNVIDERIRAVVALSVKLESLIVKTRIMSVPTPRLINGDDENALFRLPEPKRLRK
jgi:hypothetical protein